MDRGCSQYWKDMFIVNTETMSEDNDINTQSRGEIISTQEPLSFDKKYNELDIECYHPYTQEDHEIIADDFVQFINKHNKMYTGVHELITTDLLELFIGMETYVSVLRYKKNNNIMGVMIGVVCNTTASKKTKFALTSYLCVHTQLRQQGICMLLIRETLQKAYQHRLFSSYYLQENPFSNCAISLERWMRPINVEDALQKGFEFEIPPKTLKRKRKYMYMIQKMLSTEYTQNVIQTKRDILASFRFIMGTIEALETRYLQWQPTKKEWAVWCKSHVFDTIMLKKNNSIVGLITVQKKQIFIPQTQCYADVTFIPYHIVNDIHNSNNIKNLLKSAIIYSKSLNIDMLFAFESGAFTKDMLQISKFIHTGNMYLDFYNYKNSFKHNHIFTPLL